MKKIEFPYKECYKVYDWLKLNPTKLNSIEEIVKLTKYSQRSVAITIKVLIDEKILKVKTEKIWDELFKILK